VETAILQRRKGEAQGEERAQEVKKVSAAKQVVQAMLQVEVVAPGKLLAEHLQIEVGNFVRVNGK
jgi:heme oxygenase